jgi:DNA (cytosine-5)-methyltransferase 1
MKSDHQMTFLEFFAGGGMVRAGLGENWSCLFANDFDVKKCAAYRTNWGHEEIKHDDVRNITTDELLGEVDLAWASFPCQDLSLAGGGAGLKGERSGTFWPFWSLMTELNQECRAPNIIVLENVCGTLSSHGGKDFAAICGALNSEGYRYGAVVIDAALFVPHSRPRLFIIAVKTGVEIPQGLATSGPHELWHTKALLTAHRKLQSKLKKNWLWWDIPIPVSRTTNFSDLIEERPESVSWHTSEETSRLLAMMSDVNLEKVREAKRSGKKKVGALYKRTRRDEVGRKVQRAEIRFDDVAGCLRTPAGGSSRQLIVVVQGEKVRSRLISTRETARLMGLPDEYELPKNYNEAYHLTGDGVVAPVVRHLSNTLFEPIIALNIKKERVAA